MIFEARGFSKMSVTLVAGDLDIALDAGVMAKQASHDASHVLRAPPATTVNAWHTYFLSTAPVKFVMT